MGDPVALTIRAIDAIGASDACRNAVLDQHPNTPKFLWDALPPPAAADGVPDITTGTRVGYNLANLFPNYSAT